MAVDQQAMTKNSSRDDRETKPTSTEEELASFIKSVPAQRGDSDSQRCTKWQRTRRCCDLRTSVAQMSEIEWADVREVEKRVQYL